MLDFSKSCHHDVKSQLKNQRDRVIQRAYSYIIGLEYLARWLSGLSVWNGICKVSPNRGRKKRNGKPGRLVSP